MTLTIPYAVSSQISPPLMMLFLLLFNCGNYIALENRTELKKTFGCSESKHKAATVLGSMEYGPLDHAIYDRQIAPYATDERGLVKLRMARLQKLGLGDSLLLFDLLCRGIAAYPEPIRPDRSPLSRKSPR